MITATDVMLRQGKRFPEIVDHLRRSVGLNGHEAYVRGREAAIDEAIRRVRKRSNIHDMAVRDIASNRRSPYSTWVLGLVRTEFKRIVG